eukprot:1689183-Rhodomonas_salina.1
MVVHTHGTELPSGGTELAYGGTEQAHVPVLSERMAQTIALDAWVLMGKGEKKEEGGKEEEQVQREAQ